MIFCNPLCFLNFHFMHHCTQYLMMGLSTLSFATPAIWFLFTGYLALDIPQHLALPVLVTLDSRFEYFPLCRYRPTCKWCSKFTFVRFNLNESWFPNLRTLFLNCLMNNQHRLGTDLMLQLKRAGHSFLITLVIVMEVRYSSTGTETKMIHWSCWYCQSGKRTTHVRRTRQRFKLTKG